LGASTLTSPFVLFCGGPIVTSLWIDGLKDYQISLFVVSGYCGLKSRVGRPYSLGHDEVAF
jgi:hypothetical protein